jgi:hypothetical protein
VRPREPARLLFPHHQHLLVEPVGAGLTPGLCGWIVRKVWINYHVASIQVLGERGRLLVAPPSANLQFRTWH